MAAADREGPEQLTKLTIAFTVSGTREKYLRRTLDSWHKARGVQDAHLLFMVEPTVMAVHEFDAWLGRRFSSHYVHVNSRRLNCLENTKAAAQRGFDDGAEFVVVAEEDLDVADDVLEYFTWAQRYRADQDVVAICSHTFRSPPATPPGIVVREQWFSPLVWGTWADRWEDFIKPGWGWAMGNQQAWDLNLRLQIVHAKRSSIFPGQSRAIHRGTTSTLTPEPLATHFYKASLSNCFHDHYDPGFWREIPRSPELAMVV